jgi:hypothetical protein
LSFCSCANKAQDGGYRFFGVQNFRECWAGELKPEFFKRHSVKGCWGIKPNYDECDDSVETECVGPGYYNYIYEIAPGMIMDHKNYF